MLPKSTLTLWGSIKNRLRGEFTPILPVIDTARGRVNAATTITSEHTNVTPLLRLWILRLLIPLEGHRHFIDKQGKAQHDGMAVFLGLKSEPAAGGESDDLSPENKTLNGQSLLTRLITLHREAEQQAATVSLPQPLASNIQHLVQQVGLSEVECWILAFAVLLHSERLLDDACGWLGRELNTLRVYHALSVILGFPEADIRAALSYRSVLSKTALVVMNRYGKADLSDRLEVLSDTFADRLVSELGSPIDWLRDRIVPSPAPHLHLTDFPHLQSSLEFLLPFLQQVLLTRKAGVNVFLYGDPGTGKTQLTRILAQHLGCSLYEIASENEDGDPVQGQQRLSAFRAAQAFFAQQATLILFDEVEDVFSDGDGLFGKKSTAQTRKAWMNRLLEENPVPTFWLGNSIHSVDPAFIRRFDWILEVPIPPKVQRERIIRDSCGTLLSETTLQHWADCEQLAPAVVTRAAAVVATLNGQFSLPKLESALQQLVNNTLQAQGHAGLDVQKFNPLPDFYDLEFIHCDTDLKQLAQGLQANPSARLCLFGAPGTGKSAYAYWLAKQLDKPLQVKRGADILSQWVGGTEKNIAKLFREAEQEQAVLLIDEIDGFLAERNQSRYSWEVTAVNELLTQLEQYNGILMAATNRLDSLDAAAFRRFDLKIQFLPLKPEQSWQLLQRYCEVLGLAPPESHMKTDLQKLDGLTPGDFAVLARQHRFRPLKNMGELLNALQAECALKAPYQKQRMGFV